VVAAVGEAADLAVLVEAVISAAAEQEAAGKQWIIIWQHS
jgi:hypothetical protein